jgi:acylphosphatase
MDVKKKILIKGEKVHDLGYRLFLMNSAEDFMIEEFDARNVKEDGKEAVRVLVESDEKNVNKFIEFVKKKENRPEHAKVDSVDVSEYRDYVKPLESFRSGFMAYQQQKFVNVAIGVRGEVSGVREEVKSFRVESSEKQDNMLDKQDQTVNELQGFRKESKENFESLKTETCELRTETSENFNTLNTKYDVISQNMNSILMELVKEREESVKERKEFRKSIEKLVEAILASKESKTQPQQ